MKIPPIQFSSGNEEAADDVNILINLYFALPDNLKEAVDLPETIKRQMARRAERFMINEYENVLEGHYQFFQSAQAKAEVPDLGA